jgi:general secretion pathway protein L
LTTLYLRHPAKAAVDSAPAGSAPPCQFALAGDDGALLQQGAAALGSLTDLIAASRRVVLLLAASDVTLLRVKIPPLSSAQLKLALPSLVEEQILGDPQDCVLVAAPVTGQDGMRTVAVLQRSWLEVLVKALLAQGARRIKALPAQLCLPLVPGGVAAAISSDDAGLELTLRQSQYEGYGVVVAAQPAAALQTLRALVQGAPVTLYLPASELARYQELLAVPDPVPQIDQADGALITLEAEHWGHWVAASKTVMLDLVPALGSKANQARNWKRWRWPLRLALLTLLVNLVGINVEWLHLKRDADAVRLSMLQIFKATYPKETVILDPEAQMRKNIGLAKMASGQLAADGFVAISAAFGEAINGLNSNGVIATMEYRERALFVKLKPNTVDAPAQRQVKAGLLLRHFELLEPTPGIWQIRSSAGNPGAQP